MTTHENDQQYNIENVYGRKEGRRERDGERERERERTKGQEECKCVLVKGVEEKGSDTRVKRGMGQEGSRLQL